jgi:DUF1707 SHOCT-like domain
VDDRLKIRASDHDRQEVVDRLRGALADGRLKMDEFEDRMGRAYQAVTYDNLAPLYADLPAVDSKTEREAALPVMAAPARVPWRGVLAALPTTIKVLWTIWLTAVSINVVVWALVSGTTAHLVYPWPLWVAGPYGAMLFAVSAWRHAVPAQSSVRRAASAAGEELTQPAAGPPPATWWS